MSGKVFTYNLMVKESHLDFFGHVNHAVYLTLFEEARWELVTKNGYGVKKIQESGLAPIILEIKLSFLKELRLRDEIQILTQLISYEKKIGKVSQMIKRDEEICCTAEFTIALFDIRERKLVASTPEWLSAIGYE